MGTLFMNIKPAFPGFATPTSASGLWQQIWQSSRDDPHIVHVHQSFQNMHTAQLLSRDIVKILADVTIIASLGAETALALLQNSLPSLVCLRDTLIHRLLDLAPQSDGSGDDGEPSYPPEEAVRLGVLLLTMERLFSAVLPSAYFQLTHMIADWLAETVVTTLTSDDWRGHEWVALWIYFIGTSASSNNPRTRSSFIASATSVSLRLFRDMEQMMADLDVGLKEFAPSLKVYGSEMMVAFAEELRFELGVRGEKR